MADAAKILLRKFVAVVFELEGMMERNVYRDGRLLILLLAMIGMPWPNFLNPKFETKLQKESINQ